MHHQSGIIVLNGMIILTRRMYLIYFVGGLVAAVSLWICLNTILGPGSDVGRDVDLFLPWFYDFVNWFFIAAIIIHLFEAIYI